MTGNQNGALISIPGNQMFVVFHTNGEIAKTCIFARILESKCQIIWNCIHSRKLSKQMSWFFYSIDPGCQYWLNETSKLLTSPFYGSQQRYYNNLNCTWILKAEEGFYVNFELLSHDGLWVKNIIVVYM